ncbi:MAG: hypothetical protein A3B10_03680 [Candidatus Doudnabacteria bacterium RIFCSPLOWO2_01_FULL_44_21]|uniref:DUF5658 domain-containing protein n=1 Tax=Candidatus Doudnabacteria bacterium RIFCSPLOWO2_01_FULL_44_21 TaxID=1817841 RepID=A0A1F5PYD4_9BACT|nr:MAG: hypothetical protein A3B95_02165 [Candidatus Doudnabacteria bacterium RIFCSPHIGHO2_02_FULL_43_13b]OGE94864.1 MAG: hypothetical protein A3B10_03680 [Candidatus Doudnabacteria bacterium RIFCSPLOWO2_01_FULL_44_21]
MNKLRLSIASVFAAECSIWFTVIITIWAELAPGLKNFLKALTGHHWVTKSWAAVIVFLVVLAFYYMTRQSANISQLTKGVNRLIMSVILGTVIVVGFFYWHSL